MPNIPSATNEFVVGFAYDEFKNVTFVKKLHPEWQAGKLNGVGGKIEDNETPLNAMVREFEEETGQYEENWSLFLILDYPDSETTIYFFKTEISQFAMHEIRSPTDEQILCLPVNTLPWYPHIPNLSWIVPLAVYDEVRYFPTIRISCETHEEVY